MEIATILLAIGVFGAVSGIMAIGVLLGGVPLQGSCGGKGGPECVCDAFEQKKCEAQNRMMEAKLQRGK